jgi:hypothetical protein
MEGMLTTDLTNFSNFIESDSMDRVDRITRDLSIFIRQNLGSALYARRDGSTVYLLDNDENSPVYDALLKVRFIEIVANYNAQTTPELQAITGEQLIVIERDGNKLDIFLGFFPVIQPSQDTLGVLPLSFGGV